MKKLLIIITLITVGCHPLNAFELRMNNQDALKQQMIGLLLNQLFNGNQVNVGNTNINKNVIANRGGIFNTVLNLFKIIVILSILKMEA